MCIAARLYEMLFFFVTNIRLNEIFFREHSIVKNNIHFQNQNKLE